VLATCLYWWNPAYGVGDRGGNSGRRGWYLLTGADLRPNAPAKEAWPLDRAPYYLETNVSSLFAAGDVRHGSVKRCASAVGEGALRLCTATWLLANYSAVLQAETGAFLSHCSI